MNTSTLQAMKDANRWLLHHNKKPFYAQSLAPRGTTDTTEDQRQLINYAQAVTWLERHQNSNKAAGFGLGFALGPDDAGGYWQGIDLDKIIENELTELVPNLPGYVEFSPSGKGVHAIGYGQSFSGRTSRGSGVEFYSKGRYFTFTGNSIRDGEFTDLHPFIEATFGKSTHSTRETLRPLKNRQDTEIVTDSELKDLRHALTRLDADDRFTYANEAGMALKTLPNDIGKPIWLEWAATSTKFDRIQAEKDWSSFKPTQIHWRHIFNLSEQMKTDDAHIDHEPVDFFKTTAPSEFNVKNCFPEVIAHWANTHSASSGLQAFSYACSTLPVLSAATNRSVQINLGGSHTAPIILWTSLVGATGSGKSPAMNAAHRPLSELNAKEVQKIRPLQKKGETSNRPVPLRYISDTTPEALISTLSASPGHRLLVHVDEGSGWLNDMGRYSNKSNSERATYLTAWLGQKNHMITRITRGIECVPELGVSMLFGITPNKISEGYKEASAEGLLGRTMLFFIDRKHHAARSNSLAPQLLAVNSTYAKLVEHLTYITNCEITLSSEAAHIYAIRREELSTQAAILENSHPGLAGMLAKAAENMGRVAGLYALCREAHNRPKWMLQVEMLDMEMASRFMDAALSHAHAIYTSLLASDEVTKIVHACALKILRKQLSTPNLHEMTRDQFMKVGLFSSADRAIQSMAIERLGIYHWLMEDTSQRRRYSTRFGDGTKWVVNRLLFDGRFSHIAAVSQKESLAIHEALKSLSKRLI
jgi:hypothetical protein